MLTIQAEDGFPIERLPNPPAWDVRSYGRNMLLFFVKLPPPPAEALNAELPA